MKPSYDNLRIDIIERVAVVTIDRPRARNAVDGPTAKALFEAFQDFDRDDDLDVAILTGSENTFCAGADLKAFADQQGHNPLARGGLNTIGPMGPTRLQLSKPVIAAIEGHAVAGGMELALWCDLRVVAEDATFGIFCRRFGVPLIDLGTIRLPRLIGQSRAMDLILTGRPVNAKEACEIGLANRICPSRQSLPTALKLASQLSQFPQQCLRSDRKSALDQWSMETDNALQHEFDLGLVTIESGETVKGASAFSKGKGRHGNFDK